MIKKKDDTLSRVEKHIIKPNHKLYDYLDRYCFLSKNLYNYANYQIRQIFIITSKLAKDEKVTKEQLDYLNDINTKVDEFNELRKFNFRKAKLKAFKENKEFKKKLKTIKYFDKDNKYPCYEFIEFLVKDGVDYKSLMAQVSQQVLKLLDKNWLSFFEAIKKWSKNKTGFSGRPKLPKYLKKNGKNIVIFTNQNCKQENDYIKMPTCFNKYKLKTNIKGNLQQVRILPRNKYFILEVVYKINDIKLKQDNNKYISIDIGLDNLATITNNCGINPMIISGKKLKSINKYYNKQLSHYREIAKRMNDLDWTNKMNKLTIKRNNMILDLIHKASKSVINYALSCGANTIIIGNNKDWKRESSMSKKVNQSFVGIPHQLLIEKIQYKAENVGLNVIITEESYTSGTSFLDNEEPIKENYNKSRRVFRGLFISNKGIKINSDVNGSYQIMKKAFPNVFNHGIEDFGLNPIRVGI
ncbi:IS200/IS605 family element transposase accessory protein TnpB [Clostridium botulinum]|uniref:RNA-guided endonuclease InsQ/TnpB family protein n=1 Tax=Clostridium botulinum TaxID=1491 RepID=UPI001788ACCE|nr:RNA-guided endonuclease TnpB family protein [Clostridium botulinum]MBE1304115.1 IS200/IS605 family element transposase accessory protein TnpB [Clostridium botulinum]